MRVDGMVNGSQINIPNLNGLNLSEITSRLSPGDVLRAQILSIVADEVLLQLFDSTTIQATVPEDFEGEVGKHMNFVVKESQPDKLVLEEQKPVSVKIQNENADIMKSLSRLDIPQTDNNIKLARAIIENKLPLSKEIFENTVRLLKTSGEIDIPKAIIMEANKIEATPVSIKQLGLLEKGSISLGNQLNELASLLGEASDTSYVSDNNQSIKSNSPQTENNHINELKGDSPAAGENTVITANTVVKPGIVKADTSKVNTDTESAVPSANEAEVTSFDAKSFLKLVKNSLAEDNFPIKDSTLIKDEQNKLIDNAKNAELDSVISNEEKDSMPENIRKMAKELKNDVEKLFIKLDKFNSEKDIELEKSIKTIGEKLESMKEDLNNLNIPNKEVIIQKADNILNQLKFINDIKSFGYYIPIPVKINGELQSADLYVLKRNKNKKVNPEDATILLALDTTNMGRVESLLSISKRSISINMRLEGKEYEEYIRTRFVDLYNLLARKGYKLTDIKYRQISEPVNVFNVNKVANDILKSNTSGVDIRL